MIAMEQICEYVEGLKPALLMVVVQIVYAGTNVLYKLAVNDGMSLTIIVAYRFIFATATVVPLALVFERNSWPKLTWTILFQAFLCGLLGGTVYQNLYLESLVLTSATFASAMTNLIPAITFILAISFRLEKVGLATPAGKAKVAGTLLGIGGAMMLTFCKGVEINIWSTHIDLLKHGQPHQGHVASSHGSRALGALLSVFSCFCYSAWLIIQAKMSIRYPFPYSSTALMSMMASIQAVFFAFCIEKDWNQWKLGWNVRLLTVAYSGMLVSGLMITIIIWCVRKRGPLFVSIFSPLMLVLVALAGPLLLDEKLHIGSVLGAILIVCGLYAVLWGKGKEMKNMSQLVPTKSSGEATKIQMVIASSTNNANNMSNQNYNDNITDTDTLKRDCGNEEKQNVTE